MQVIVSGMLTHYERAGKGKTILLLPGWADTSQSWLGIEKRLARSFDVIVLDIPGFGGSQSPSSAWDLSDYGRFIAAFLDKIGAANLYAVVGHSNGGAMAIRALSGGQLTAEKLVLAASAGIRTAATGRKRLLRAVSVTGRVASAPLPGAMKKRLRSKLYSAVGSDMLVAEHMEETFKKVVADDVQSDAGKLQLPALLVYGDKDTATPLSFGETYQRLIPGSKLEVIPGAGHFLHVENADVLVPVIERFLA